MSKSKRGRDHRVVVQVTFDKRDKVQLALLNLLGQVPPGKRSELCRQGLCLAATQIYGLNLDSGLPQFPLVTRGAAGSPSDSAAPLVAKFLEEMRERDNRLLDVIAERQVSDPRMVDQLSALTNQVAQLSKQQQTTRSTTGGFDDSLAGCFDAFDLGDLETTATVVEIDYEELRRNMLNSGNSFHK